MPGQDDAFTWMPCTSSSSASDPARSTSCRLASSYIRYRASWVWTWSLEIVMPYKLKLHKVQACCAASMLVAWCHTSGTAGQLPLALPVLLPASCRYGPACDCLLPGPCTTMTRLPPRTNRGRSNPDGKKHGGCLQHTLDPSHNSQGPLDQPHHKGSCLSPGLPGLCRAPGARRSLPGGAPPPRPHPVLPAAQASVSGQASGSSELDDGVCRCSVRGSVWCRSAALLPEARASAAAQ